MSTALRAARRVAVASVAAIVLAACTGPGVAYPEADDAAPAAVEPGAAPVVVEHAQGTLTLDAVPQRVYSLDWGVTSVLTALDVPVHGVAKSLVPAPFTELAASPGVIDLGTLHEPCFETIAGNPADLVIIAARSAVHFDEMSRIAPTIDLSVDSADNVAGSKAMVRTLGQVFDREAQAEALIANLEATVAQIRDLTADAGDALIILTSGANVAAFGPGGRFGFLHDDLGFATAAQITEDGRHGQAISFEFLLENDPQWLFVIDRDSAIQSGGQAAQQVLANDIVRRTQAYLNDRIVYVDTTTWYIAGTGVVSLQSVADDILAILSADAAS